jgi:hypothetical protein
MKWEWKKKIEEKILHLKVKYQNVNLSVSKRQPARLQTSTCWTWKRQPFSYFFQFCEKRLQIQIQNYTCKSFTIVKKL